MVKISEDFTNCCKVIFEYSIDVLGFSYTFIYGHHVNGGFLCVPRWKWGCELSNFPNSLSYNIEKITACGAPIEVAEEIALHIENFEQNRYRHKFTQ